MKFLKLFGKVSVIVSLALIAITGLGATLMFLGNTFGPIVMVPLIVIYISLVITGALYSNED